MPLTPCWERRGGWRNKEQKSFLTLFRITLAGFEFCCWFFFFFFWRYFLPYNFIFTCTAFTLFLACYTVLVRLIRGLKENAFLFSLFDCHSFPQRNFVSIVNRQRGHIFGELWLAMIVYNCLYYHFSWRGGEKCFTWMGEWEVVGEISLEEWNNL